MQTKPKKKLWIWALLLGIFLSGLIIALYGDDGKDVIIRNDAEYLRLLGEAERDSKHVLQKLFNEEEISEQDRQDLRKSEIQFHALMQYSPEKFAPYLPLGMIYHSFGRLDAAEQHLRRCIDFTPPLTDNKAVMETSAEAHYQLARVLNDKQQFELASGEASTAIELNPDNVNYYIGRSVSYSQLKQPDKARQDLKKALEIDPSNSKAKSLLKFLDRGSKGS